MILCDMSGMTETLPDRLDRLMREAGYNPRSLSLKASLGATAVRDIIDGRIASPRYATIEALAGVLGVGVEVLANGVAATAAAAARPDQAQAQAQGQAQPRDLPVYGAAQ